MHQPRFYLFLLVLLCFQGCEVPDVQPFSKATTEMGTAIEASLRRVAADLQRVRIQPGPDDPADVQSQLLAQGRQLGQQQQQVTAAAGRFTAVAHAFDGYAKALDAAAAAGKKRGQTIDKVFKATDELVKAAASFTGPLSAPLDAGGQVLQATLDNLNKAHTINTLAKFASADQDTLVQRTARLLQAGLAEFARLDADAYALAANNQPTAATDLTNYYRRAQRRQAVVTKQLSRLVGAQNEVLAGHYANLGSADSPGLLDNLDDLDDPSHQLQQAYTRFQNSRRATGEYDPARRAALLHALQQREVFYKNFFDLPQSQYDAEQARRKLLLDIPRQQSLLQLQQGQQLLGTWATTHHELRLLLVRARYVSRQDVVDYAKTLQQLAAALRNDTATP